MEKFNNNKRKELTREYIHISVESNTGQGNPVVEKKQA